MKLTKIILFAFSLFLLAGCSSNSDVQKLMSAYSMMDHDSINEAEMVLTLYADTKLDNESQAIYNLAKTRLYYLQDKSIKNDSLINTAINYFKNSDKNQYLLAEAYYYKGVCQRERNNIDDAIINLKEAEIIASNLDDIALTHKIYETLSSLFLSTNANHLTKEYVYKNLQLAKKEKNYNWYLYAACFVANYYLYVNNIDSANYYFDSMKPYLNTIKKEGKSEILSSIGMSIASYNLELAEEYLKESLAIKPNVGAFSGLSLMSFTHGDYEKAIEYSQEAYKYAKTPQDTLSITSILLRIRKAIGDYEGACALYDTINILNNKVYDVDRENNIVKVQAQYNILAKEREYQNRIQNFTLIAIIVVVLIIVYLFYNHVRMMKMKENQLKDQLLLEVYNGKIKDLETSESASSAQVLNLKEKVTQLQQKQGERLSEGKKLFDHISNGGTIISWAKQDYNNFFDYYSLIDMPFMAHMEKDYDNLSARSMIYLILCNIGKSEEEIEKIFGISNSAIRSIKSRTKSRLKNQNQEEN